MSPPPAAPSPHFERLHPAWIGAAPAVFVVLWSTGYMGALYGLPYAEPFTFLFVRFSIVAGLMLLVSLVTRAPWPASWRVAGHAALTGFFMHGVTFMALFLALDRGVPSGVMALIMGLQPLLTAVAAGPLLGERITRRQWLGLVLGLGGMVVVVADKLDVAGADLAGAATATVAVLGITAGTLYQKRHGAAVGMRTGHTLQFAAAAAATGLFSWLFETGEIRWTGEFVFGLAWLVFVLSLGAISLLYTLIRRGAASRLTSLFYLVPPVTAVIGFVLFGETLSALALLGMVISVAGVALVTRSP